MSDKNVKKKNSDWGKKWFENNKIFIPEDKISEMEYLHGSMTRYAFESLFNKRGNSA